MNTEMRRRLSTPIVRGLLVCLLGASGFAAAAAITEDEPPGSNDWPNPKRVEVPAEGLTISARINRVADVPDADVDYFAFEANEGDTLSIEIKGALKPDGAGTCLGFPGNTALYDSAGGSPLAGGMGDCEGLTEPSFKTTVSGPGRRTYIVGVSTGYNYFFDAGETAAPVDAILGGTYQLVISGVTSPTAPPPVEQPPVEQPPVEQPPVEQPPVEQPPVEQPPVTQPPVTQPPVTQPPVTQPPAATKNVPIVVRHWHQDERDLDRRGGRDPIVVAILSVRGFRAKHEVDPNSLTFGRTGYEKSLYRCNKSGKDINRDGRMDMVCYFKADVANFQTGDLNGKLEGKTMSGQRIKGVAALRIFSVPKERRGFKHHGQRDDRKNNKDNRNR